MYQMNLPQNVTTLDLYWIYNVQHFNVAGLGDIGSILSGSFGVAVPSSSKANSKDQ